MKILQRLSKYIRPHRSGIIISGVGRGSQQAVYVGRDDGGMFQRFVITLLSLKGSAQTVVTIGYDTQAKTRFAYFDLKHIWPFLRAALRNRRGVRHATAAAERKAAEMS